MVALVDDHEPVPGRQLGDVVPARERLDHRDVDDAAWPAAPGTDDADLSTVDAEVGDEALTPLLEERLAIDHHQRRHRAMGDDATRQHRLPGAGRCDEDPQVVATEDLESVLLTARQRRLQVDVDPSQIPGLLPHDESTARLGHDCSSRLAQPARQQEPVERLAVAAKEARRLPGRQAQPLLLVVGGVVERGQVLERREQRRWEADPVDREHRPGIGHDRRLAASASSRPRRRAIGRLKRTSGDLADATRPSTRSPRASCDRAPRGTPTDRRTAGASTGSRNTVVPRRRHAPWSGSAIRLPNDPFGMKSWAGKSRS